MRIEPLCRRFAYDVFFSVEHNRTRRIVAGNRIHQDESVQPDDLMREVKRRSADIGDINVLPEAVNRPDCRSSCYSS